MEEGEWGRGEREVEEGSERTRRWDAGVRCCRGRAHIGAHTPWPARSMPRLGLARRTLRGSAGAAPTSVGEIKGGKGGEGGREREKGGEGKSKGKEQGRESEEGEREGS